MLCITVIFYHCIHYLYTTVYTAAFERLQNFIICKRANVFTAVFTVKYETFCKYIRREFILNCLYCLLVQHVKFIRMDAVKAGVGLLMI